jgi:hypothetical protein
MQKDAARTHEWRWGRCSSNLARCCWCGSFGSHRVGNGDCGAMRVARPYGSRCRERGALRNAICAQLFLFVASRRCQEVYKLRCMAAGRGYAYSSSSLGVMLFAERNLRKDQETWGQLPFRCHWDALARNERRVRAIRSSPEHT